MNSLGQHLSFLCLFALMGSLYSQNIEYIDFTGPEPKISIDTTSGANSWQIGVPSKLTFDSSYTATRAILTDTLNPYPVNDSSSFTLDFDIYGGQPSVSFYHRTQSTAGKDGGFVELTTDNGQSWLLLNDTTFRMFLNPSIYGLEVWNFYESNDSISKGFIGFSGPDSGWVFSQIVFPCMAIKTFWPMQLRFTFISDSIPDSLDGWMLDHFVIDNTGDCSNLNEFSGLRSLNTYPNPADKSFIVVEAGDFYPAFEVKLVDNQGAIVRVMEYEGGTEVRMDLRDISPGLYTVLLHSKDKPIGSARTIVR